MEKYNFDEAIDRRHSGSAKWDEADVEVLPFWVADMDFRTAPCIIEALKKRVEHGIFGYTHVSDNYYSAVVNWFHNKHGWAINPEAIIYTTGVVPAISAIIKGLLTEGDGIMVMTPAYNCFFSSIRNMGCRLAEVPLMYHKDGYTIDFDLLEKTASQHWVRMLILCNPHNPVGRVWTKSELKRIGDICLANNVFVLSDEIHCELTFNSHVYTPYQSLGHEYAQKSVACISPTKAFNIAGLQIANIVCPDPIIKARVDRGINDHEVCDVNPFGVEALMAAYEHGDAWLKQLKSYLWNNYITVRSFFNNHLPMFPITPLEGTYLVWINIAATGIGSAELSKILIRDEKIWLSPGSTYGEGGTNFLRLNIACPNHRLTEGLKRLNNGLKKHI